MGIILRHTVGAEAKLGIQIRKKLAKGKSIEVIAEEVEEDLDTVKAIVLKLCDNDGQK